MTKERRFEGLKKRDFMIEHSKTFFQKDGVTVCVMKVLFPTKNLMPFVDKAIVDRFTKGFPELKFNFSPINPGFVVRITGKSKCTSGDEYNDKLGRTIAYSKAQAKAYGIVSRLASLVATEYDKQRMLLSNVGDFFNTAKEREVNFVKNI